MEKMTELMNFKATSKLARQVKLAAAFCDICTSDFLREAVEEKLQTIYEKRLALDEIFGEDGSI